MIDPSDNELAALESIHLFVEILDLYFHSVCELDLVFNFWKVFFLSTFDVRFDSIIDRCCVLGLDLCCVG
jgi:hypothetical protein